MQGEKKMATEDDWDIMRDCELKLSLDLEKLKEELVGQKQE